MRFFIKYFPYINIAAILLYIASLVMRWGWRYDGPYDILDAWVVLLFVLQSIVIFKTSARFFKKADAQVSGDSPKTFLIFFAASTVLQISNFGQYFGRDISSIVPIVPGFLTIALIYVMHSLGRPARKT